MLRCKIVISLFSLFPFKFWKGFLLHSHIQKCERCMSLAASLDEVKALIVQQNEVEDFRDLWSAIKSGIVETEQERKAALSFRRRWALAVACFVVVCLAGVLIFNSLPQNESPMDQEGEARFRINSIRVGDEPATPFVYQSKDSDIILVWAEKSM